MLELLIGIAAWAGLAAFCILLLAHYRAECAARQTGKRSGIRSNAEGIVSKLSAHDLDTAA